MKHYMTRLTYTTANYGASWHTRINKMGQFLELNLEYIQNVEGKSCLLNSLDNDCHALLQLSINSMTN